MADISSFLSKILEAIYGEEVRGSIHDALSAMNVESNAAMNYAATAQDSAKASAEAAKLSEDNAKDSETKAAGSELNTKASELEAKAAAENAKTSETNAKASETNAKASELNAAASEVTALQKAAEAEASKNAAALSEANALAAEERTKEVREDVEVLGAQATADKNAAEAAKEGAEAAKAAAKLSETNSAASETSALNAKAAAEAARDEALTAEANSEENANAAALAKTDAQAAKAAAEESAADAAESAETAKQYSGKPSMPQDGTWWIWNAETAQYEDTGIACDMPGPTGNGIESIELTSGDHSPASTDIYTITMTDGTTINVPVYHGANGTGVGDVIGVGFDLEIPVDSWDGLEASVSDSRLLASARYKYLIDAYSGDSKTEMVECGVQINDITENGVITFTADIAPINPITLNVIRFELGANST